MKILVNYSADEAQYLTQLAYYLKRHNLEAVSTKQNLEIGELLQKARISNSQAILICNEQTLRNCVPGTKPTLDLYRGSRLDFSIPAIVTNKLEHINTVNHGSWLLEKDLAKFASITNKPTPFNFVALSNSSMLEQAYYELSRCLVLAYDIETDKVDIDPDPIQAPASLITCASYSGLTPEGTIITYVLPLVDFGTDHWETDGEYKLAIKFLQDVNKLPIPKVMHNGLYDCFHSIRYHAEPHNWVLDTMAFAHSEFSELPKTLDFVASYVLPDYMQWSQEASAASANKDVKRYWGYNAKDTWYTLRIVLTQLRTLPAYAKRNYANKFKFVYPALYCGFEGWKIDNAERERKREKAVEIYNRSLTELRTMFADPNFNPGSWQQKQKYLYKVLGAKNPKAGKSPTGTDEKNLLLVSQQHPLLALVCDRLISYMKTQKEIGTYYDFKQYNERLLYALNPFGTETERMACSASSFWCGTQVQNIPGYAKSMLVADEGYELCEPDANKSEARCTAYLAQEPNLILALEDPEKDFYKVLGTLLFQMPYEDVTDFFRNKVLKKINHGTNYMMKARTFLENIGAKILYETAPKLGIQIVEIPKRNHPNELTLLQFSGYLLELYHSPFPRVRNWYEEIRHEVSTTHKLTSPLGHVRYFFGDINKQHELIRSAVAHQPQNLSVTILNEGFWKLYKHCVLPSGGKFRLKAQIHDSCPFQYVKEERDIWVPKALQLMDNPVVVHGKTLRIPMDAKIGQNWKDMEQYKWITSKPTSSMQG